MSWNEQLKKKFNQLHNTHERMMSDISKVEYVGWEDYKEDLDEIDYELEQIEFTINYFKDRRRILNEWKRSIQIRVGEHNGEVVCANCKFFSLKTGWCSKCKSGVVGEASCDDFEWK